MHREEYRAFQVAVVGKNPPANAGRCKRFRFDPWVGKIPWSRAQQRTPVFLPGEFMDGGTWRATVQRLQRVGHNLATKQDKNIHQIVRIT